MWARKEPPIVAETLTLRTEIAKPASGMRPIRFQHYAVTADGRATIPRDGEEGASSKGSHPVVDSYTHRPQVKRGPLGSKRGHQEE